MIDEEEAARTEIDRMVEDGIAALEDENYDLAAELFRRVVQRAPFRHDARDYLAFALDQQFAREHGRPTARRVDSAVGTSSAAASTSSRSRPPRFRFPVWLGAATLALAVLVVGVVAVGNRLDLRGWVGNFGKPKGDPVTERLLAEFRKADTAVAEGEFLKARTILTGALEIAKELDPPDSQMVEDRIAEVYAAEAGTYLLKLNYPRALEVAEEGLKHNDTLAELNYVAGKCYEREAVKAGDKQDDKKEKKYYKMAIEALEKATKNDPRHVPALHLLAWCYLQDFNTAKALETWKLVVEESPNSKEGRTASKFLSSYDPIGKKAP